MRVRRRLSSTAPSVRHYTRRTAAPLPTSITRGQETQHSSRSQDAATARAHAPGKLIPASSWQRGAVLPRLALMSRLGVSPRRIQPPAQLLAADPGLVGRAPIHSTFSSAAFTPARCPHRLHPRASVRDSLYSASPFSWTRHTRARTQHGQQADCVSVNHDATAAMPSPT